MRSEPTSSRRPARLILDSEFALRPKICGIGSLRRTGPLPWAFRRWLSGSRYRDPPDGVAPAWPTGVCTIVVKKGSSDGTRDFAYNRVDGNGFHPTAPRNARRGPRVDR